MTISTITLVQAFISCRLDYCNSLLYGISDRLLQRLQSVQTLPPAWSQTPVVVTTSHQCYGSCTGCQSVSESCSRSRSSCISRSLELLPRTWPTTVVFCRTLVIAHCGTVQMTCKLGDKSFSAARLQDCEMIFHPDYGGRDSASIASDDL